MSLSFSLFCFLKKQSSSVGWLLLAVTKKVEVVEFIRVKYIKQKERIVKKCSINGEKRKYIQFAIPILQFNFVIFIINIIAATCFVHVNSF